MKQTEILWKAGLKQMKLEALEREHPEAFKASGSYTMKVKPYNDRTANGLTKAVIDFIRFNGGDAQRINTTGAMRKVKGRMQWTKSGVRRGAADIHAIIKGRAVSIEIKIGRDKMSNDQHKERERIEKAGGLYFIARSMGEFIQWYEKQFVGICSHA